MPLITCEKLSFSYENEMVVKELSFCVEEGDYICIIGENGSGKTTLLKGLLGLKKPVNGMITRAFEREEKGCGYLPQQTALQRDFPASVEEVVMSGFLKKRGFFPWYQKEEKEKAMEWMKVLGVSEWKKKSYRELSGGQQQRVLLARALLATEKILFLDEPTSGLDPLAEGEFYALIKKLNQEKGITIIMVSHAIKEAVTYAEHILHLSHNSHFFGSVEAYQRNELSKEFLGGERG